MTQCVHCRTLISNVAKMEGTHVSDFCVHAWRLRSEYLENLGCHDHAFAGFIYHVSCAEYDLLSRVFMALLSLTSPA